MANGYDAISDKANIDMIEAVIRENPIFPRDAAEEIHRRVIQPLEKHLPDTCPFDCDICRDDDE